MDKILDIVNGWITAAVSSGALQMKQVLLFIFIAGPMALVIWKIRGIIAFVNEVRNSKLNELQRLLDSHELSDEVRICIKEDIKRITSYRMTGISDVASQKIILRLFVENRDSISVGFFKKFRTFLLTKDGVLVFKKGFSFWFENGMYAFFSLHFLLIAALSLILSIYRHEQIPVWGHLILYSVAIVMFLFFIAFGKMIPRPEECNLLNKILQTQYNDSSE
ncbi:hypothetical protein R5D33_004070 [Salmonella enterica]|nr:hypothetical protein [Salmonella enterica]QJY67090.1 hypothetical protein HPG81_11580 [Salmonella enterica subsp. VII serovar 1,40:g,z51:--]QUZ22946.1 hypothetical protein JYN32_18465 [Salmonella enterica subsp. VII str. CFSAN000554]HBZ8551746.1 hypothetical protein [Salmonella enterica subsp. houtenae]HCA3676179.1 hypothetical protein [Salmonella enterica subsp. houtenae serovar Houten]